MPVIARDAVASDHLVYAWPFPIGPEEYEVACAEDELVVMCPSWLVGDRLGPGRHRWRTPDPMRPVSAYFVLTTPVEVSFDMITQFGIPTTGQPVRLRGSGSVQVRCLDPALLVAQFVGLPFDHVNEGIVRSVSRSIERMLARLLTRRVVMAGTPAAVTDPQMLPNIIEELVAYNPAAGAVFGIELVRFGHLQILADDGSRPWQQMSNGRVAAVPPPVPSRPDIPLLETVRSRPASAPTLPPPLPVPPRATPSQPPPLQRAQTQPGPDGRPSEASGEIDLKKKATAMGHAVAPPPAASAAVGNIEVPRSTDEITQPGIDIVRDPKLTAVSGEIGGSKKKKAEPEPEKSQPAQLPHATPPPPDGHSHGSILGIGMSHIGSAPVATEGVTSGEITKKIAPGGRVLVPGPNGLMQSATVRQLLQGYYELEVGGSGETIWVPVNGVVPE